MADANDKPGFVPVGVGELTDEKLLAAEFRLLRGEVRDGFALILAHFKRNDTRVTALEERVDYDAKRIDKHEERIAALEAAAKEKP